MGGAAPAAPRLSIGVLIEGEAVLDMPEAIGDDDGPPTVYGRCPTTLVGEGGPFEWAYFPSQREFEIGTTAAIARRHVGYEPAQGDATA